MYWILREYGGSGCSFVVFTGSEKLLQSTYRNILLRNNSDSGFKPVVRSVSEGLSDSENLAAIGWFVGEKKEGEKTPFKILLFSRRVASALHNRVRRVVLKKGGVRMIHVGFPVGFSAGFSSPSLFPSFPRGVGAPGRMNRSNSEPLPTIILFSPEDLQVCSRKASEFILKGTGRGDLKEPDGFRQIISFMRHHNRRFGRAEVIMALKGRRDIEVSDNFIDTIAEFGSMKDWLENDLEEALECMIKSGILIDSRKGLWKYRLRTARGEISWMNVLKNCLKNGEEPAGA